MDYTSNTIACYTYTLSYNQALGAFFEAKMNSSAPKLKDKFIGFVDILGFSDLVQSSEADKGMTLSEIENAVSYLGSESDRKDIRKYGPTICPESERINDDLDFEITQSSDSVIVSTEVSVSGALTLLNHCFVAAFRLMKVGLMCRGHVRRGQIYHRGTKIIGTGYQDAVIGEKAVSIFKKNEEKSGTPFIEVDQSLVDYLRTHGDKCSQEVIPRLLEEADGLVAVFPFKRLNDAFTIGPNFDPIKELQNNELIKKYIRRMIDEIHKYVDTQNSDAVRKVSHYVQALEHQLEVFDQVDEAIDHLSQPFPRG